MIPGRMKTSGKSHFKSPAMRGLVLSLAFLVFPGWAPVEAAGAGMEVAARPTGPLPKGELKPGKPSDLVLRTQKALAKIGIYKGPQDGRMTAARKPPSAPIRTPPAYGSPATSTGSWSKGWRIPFRSASFSSAWIRCGSRTWAPPGRPC